MSTLAVIPNQTSPAPIDPRRAALAVDPFEPQTMEALYKFAEVVSTTDFAPKEFKGRPDACFVAMVYGRGLGLGALQALQGVCVINGKPSVYGETFWAVILSHPDFVTCEETTSAEEASVVITRRGQPPYTATFTLAEAKVAKLTDKEGPWKTYPKGQLLWRARHRAAVARFADALKGILPREVALDYIDGDTVTRLPDPPALTAAAATQAPTPAKAGGTPTPAAVDPNSFLTPAQVAEFDAARKLSGHKATPTRAFMTDVLKVAKMGEVRLSQFPLAMTWANTPAAEAGETQPPTKPAETVAAVAPERAQESEAVEDVGPQIDRSKTPEEIIKACMVAVQMGIFEQDTFTKQHTVNGVTDWAAMGKKLEVTMRDMGLEP